MIMMMIMMKIIMMMIMLMMCGMRKSNDYDDNIDKYIRLTRKGQAKDNNSVDDKFANVYEVVGLR